MGKQAYPMGRGSCPKRDRCLACGKGFAWAALLLLAMSDFKLSAEAASVCAGESRLKLAHRPTDRAPWAQVAIAPEAARSYCPPALPEDKYDNSNPVVPLYPQKTEMRFCGVTTHSKQPSVPR